MSCVVACPACAKKIRLPEGAGGKKVKCGGCGTINRIEEIPGGYALHVQRPAERTVAMEASAEQPDKRPVGPKLKTWKDRMREEGANAPAGGSRRRSTIGRGRRRRI